MNQASHTDRNSRHEVIREIISESLEALARQSPDRPPTARAISTKSGYSVGSIYKYFGSIGALAAFLFFKKQSMAAARIRSIIDSHDPHDDVATLSQKIVDVCFANLRRFNPKIARFAFEMALKHSEKPASVDAVLDGIAAAMVVASSRDQTGSFRRLDDTEARLVLRGVASVIRAPLLEGSPFFGTEQHEAIAKDVLLRSLSNYTIPSGSSSRDHDPDVKMLS